MNVERIDYKEIKSSFLDGCYTYCQHKINNINLHGSIWTNNESEQAYAYELFDNAYDLPIENLMLEVVTLVLMAGRGPEQAENYHRDRIAGILSENKLDELIADISEEERKDLIYDMSLLKLI